MDLGRPLELFKSKVLSSTETWIPAWNNDGNMNQQMETREESLEPKTDSKPNVESTGFKVQLIQYQYSHKKQDTHPYFAIKSNSSTGKLKALPSSSPSGLIPFFWHLTTVLILELTWSNRLVLSPLMVSWGFNLELNFRSQWGFFQAFFLTQGQETPRESKPFPQPLKGEFSTILNSHGHKLRNTNPPVEIGTRTFRRDF